jgi:hypothetical protein
MTVRNMRYKTTRKGDMKIKVELSSDELAEMQFESIEEFMNQMVYQLNDAVLTRNGNAGADWMVDYQLDAEIVMNGAHTLH